MSDGILHDQVVHVGGGHEVRFFPVVPVIGGVRHPARGPHASPGGRNRGRPGHGGVGLPKNEKMHITCHEMGLRNISMDLLEEQTCSGYSKLKHYLCLTI